MNEKPPGPKKKMPPITTTTRAGLTREVQAKIGQQLRSMYNDVVDQGVPDRFMKLLGELDQGEAKDKQKDQE